MGNRNTLTTVTSCFVSRFSPVPSHRAHSPRRLPLRPGSSMSETWSASERRRSRARIRSSQRFSTPSAREAHLSRMRYGCPSLACSTPSPYLVNGLKLKTLGFAGYFSLAAGWHPPCSPEPERFKTVQDDAVYDPGHCHHSGDLRSHPCLRAGACKRRRAVRARSVRDRDDQFTRQGGAQMPSRGADCGRSSRRGLCVASHPGRKTTQALPIGGPFLCARV